MTLNQPRAPSRGAGSCMGRTADRQLSGVLDGAFGVGSGLTGFLLARQKAATNEVGVATRLWLGNDQSRLANMGKTRPHCVSCGAPVGSKPTFL